MLNSCCTFFFIIIFVLTFSISINAFALDITETDAWKVINEDINLQKLPEFVKVFLVKENIPIRPPEGKRFNIANDRQETEIAPNGNEAISFYRRHCFSIEYDESNIYEFFLGDRTDSNKVENQASLEEVVKRVQEIIPMLKNTPTDNAIITYFLAIEPEYKNTGYDDDGNPTDGEWLVSFDKKANDVLFLHERFIITLNRAGELLSAGNIDISDNVDKAPDAAKPLNFSVDDIKSIEEITDVYGLTMKQVFSRFSMELQEGHYYVVNEPKLFYINPRQFFPVNRGELDDKHGAVMPEGVALLAWCVDVLRFIPENRLDLTAISLWFSPDTHELLGYASYFMDIKSAERRYFSDLPSIFPLNKEKNMTEQQ